MRVVSAGEVKVNDGLHVFVAHDDVVCLYIDMETKRAKVLAVGSNGDIPCITVESSDGSLHLDESKLGTPTEIEFPEYAGFSVFSCDIARYTISLCLTKVMESL